MPVVVSIVTTLLWFVVVKEGTLRDPDKVTDPEIVTTLADRLAASQAKLPSPSAKSRGAFLIYVAPVLALEETRNTRPIVTFFYK